MKIFLPLVCFCLSLGVISCSEEESSASEAELNHEETDVVVVQSVHPGFLSVTKRDSLCGNDYNYYVVSYAGVAKEEDAIQLVDSLLPSFPNAGYLWIPDFASLSGKEMFAVFLDQGKYPSYILEETVQKYKQKIPGIYVVRVDHNSERWVAYSPLDIRINNEKQRMILIYATPEDEDEYAEQGGEDWGWFVNDVGEYFADHHPEIIFESVYYSGLLPEEIKMLEDAVEPEGFGYILVDGKEMSFIGHDMPGSVISSACEFFGFQAPDSDY